MKQKNILILLACLSLCACSLEEKPTSFSTRENFYDTYSQCRAALDGCYMPLNKIYSANYILVTEACTDLWHSGSTTTDACLDVTPAKPQFGAKVWENGYLGVMYCNECIECIAQSPVSEELKAPMLAEARVLRALYYYNLTCMFGGVPFYTCMVADNSTLEQIRVLPRTPAEEIRTTLYQDLKENALPYFTEDNSLKCTFNQTPDYRAGYPLCLMLMAKMALWEEKWDDALYALDLLEELYGELSEERYPLEQLRWRYKNSDESIFELQHAWSFNGVQYPGNVANILTPPNAASEEDPQQRLYDGVLMPELGNETSSWNSLVANNHFCIFRPKKGTAKEEQVVSHAIFQALPLTFDEEFDEPDGRWYTTLDLEAVRKGVIRGKKIDRRVYELFGLGNLQTGDTFQTTRRYGTGWGGPRFWCPGIVLSNDSNNYKLFRYADAVLMKAECLIGKGENQEAITYLNYTRARAGVDPLPDSLEGEALHKELRDERARELGGEFHRKFDLVRWGIWYEETLQYNTNSKIKDRIKPYHRYYPIPERECALSSYALTNDEYLEN